MTVTCTVVVAAGLSTAVAVMVTGEEFEVMAVSVTADVANIGPAVLTVTVEASDELQVTKRVALTSVLN
jgi:hypothetical protein